MVNRVTFPNTSTSIFCSPLVPNYKSTLPFSYVKILLTLTKCIGKNTKICDIQSSFIKIYHEICFNNAFIIIDVNIYFVKYG